MRSPQVPRSYPAEQDRKFAKKSWAPGYLTTRPGARAKAFLYPGTYDPAVLTHEERLKDTLASAELRQISGGGKTTSRPPASLPALYALGRHDTIVCGRTSDCGKDPNARSTEFIVPDSGHSINVSKGARLFYEHTFTWLESKGIGVSQPG
ncbi:hypothetical protein [Nonomuraea longicatena]|uniref:hypothetical protein n=1 Tax=Nonomuraea longicatena TaxID=83682 RepID=UPI0031D7D694